MAAKKRKRSRIYDVDLRDFSAVGPLLAAHARRHYGTCASYCFRNSRPRGDIVMELRTESDATYVSVGVLAVTKAVRATLGDPDDAAEHGAYGIALLVAAKNLGMRFVKRTYKGPGFDFYLTPPTSSRARHPDDIFGDVWGFEVSGIFAGDSGAVTKRLNRKRDQVADAVKLLPVLVAIVEFSQPVAIFEVQGLRP